MSSVKDLLKEAKNELARGDYEEAIEISKEVLKKEENNYFAYVFMGKAYSCIANSVEEALNSYIRATELVPSNVLGWKGLFLLINSNDVLPTHLTFNKYFDLCGDYSNVLLSQELPLVDLIHEMRTIRKKYPDCEESFLRHMCPGSQMGESISRHFITPQECLSKLIQIINSKEKEQVSKIVSRERLKLSANDPLYQTKINSLAWEVYQSSDVEDLYVQLINISDDDEERSKFEEELLDHRIVVLKSMPIDLKGSYFQKVKSMVEDMVLVGTKSEKAWKLYFEWQDCTDLNSLDGQIVMKYFTTFPKEPLSVILYAWVCSKYSSYDIKQLNTTGKDEPQAIKDEPDMTEIEQSELSEMTENEESIPALLEADILETLMENISRAKTSIIAYRIISQYYLLSAEYAAALPYIKSGISLTAFAIRDLGAHLINSKFAFTLDLASAYTYFDAPKHHKTALSLFDKVLSEDEFNARAKLGKGLIFMERENWIEAKTFLSEVAEKFSDNLDILSQLGWSEANLGNHDRALEIFNNVLNSIEGVDIKTCELKAANYWRQAKTYLLLQKEEELKITDSDMRYVTLAYRSLIHSLKVLDTFSKSYSTLGDIYANYYSDTKRAFGCYYKAFELDSSDIVAAKYMVETYCNSGNWSAAESISKILVKTDGAKKYLRYTCWPFRVIGIANLERQQESDAIEWFQSALRIEPNNVESWVGLGQSYLSCGRIEASIRVFEKATELDPDHLYAKYFTAQSLSEMGEYVKSISIFEEIIMETPKEESFQVSYSETLMKHAQDLFNQGFLTKSVSIAIEAISVMSYIATDLNRFPSNLWLSLFSALKLFILVESKVDKLPIETVVSIFENCKIKDVSEIDDIDGVTISSLLTTADDNVVITCQSLILAAKCAISTGNIDQATGTLKSSLWHNLGMAELISYLTLKDNKHKESSIFCFKKAIKYQSNSFESWVGLGIATMDANWKVSQHCFIKAIALAPRESHIWFNLAVLALKQDDIEFTRQVKSRLQSIAPQDSSARLGMALV
ncbi:hypothetical protein Kpol_1050p112, partial [Vanderwaltozyma polyspora DSM 70294]